MPSRRKKILSLVKRFLLVFVALIGAYGIVLTGMVVWGFEAKLKRWPVLIHSDTFTVRVGDHVEGIQLTERLKRLGYVETTDLIPGPGHWTSSPTEFRVFLRPTPLTGYQIATGPVRMSLVLGVIRSMQFTGTGAEADELVIEPELLDVVPAKGYSKQLCRLVPLDRINPLLVAAIVLTEDTRFFSHVGIDFVSIHRALLANLKAGRYAEGASTVPQQLIRMTLLSPEKTLWRKFNEVCLALVADAIYSKERILEAYLNRVYFGQCGPFPVHGVAAASWAFFGKDQADLDPAECALLAATIKAPNIIRPSVHPERSRGRRNVILGLLFKAGKISRDQYDAALTSPLTMSACVMRPVKAGAFVALALQKWEKMRQGARAGNREHDLVTSLDPLFQSVALQWLKDLGQAGETAHFVVATPATGEIKAYVAPTESGWSGASSDLVTLFPLVTIPALTPNESGIVRVSLTTPMFQPSGPQGALTLRQAFLSDRSALLSRLVSNTGPEKVVAALSEFGVRGKVSERTVSIEPVTPMETAQIYAIAARLGDAGELHPFKMSPNDSDNVATRARKHVSVRQDVLYLANYLLSEPETITLTDSRVDKKRARASLLAATDGDGLWGIAYRPDILVLVRIRGTGLTAVALERNLKKLLPEPSSRPTSSVATPDGIVFRKICAGSGLRATSLCPQVVQEAFLKGSQPAEWCALPHETAVKRPSRSSR
ncbi:MAG: transglycosylase domain-containing protein [Thermodesulfobacteriota bacterium]